MSAAPSITHLAKAAAATTRPTRLQEYLVVIRDLPRGDRTTIPNTPISLAHQTFTGQILSPSRQRATTEKPHQKLPGLGNVIALRALSAEAVHEELKAHPYAQGIWDLTSVRIWPVETVHTSLMDGGEEGQGQTQGQGA
ncbi:hypothetical protein BJY04DRAFT_224703 [Aspergillus karnatakaensis]|uniref:uncharacterized protein n=1 Tax=Aspergillus karnatakaensis TaxID=1810916 RepID=UPI003CCD9836